MSLSDVFIRRPVFATVLSLILVLVGLVSYTRLHACANIRRSTSRSSPCPTDYPGASAEIIETQVTQILEESLAGIEGIELMTSISRPERSQITVRFIVERDPDDAASDVRDRVSRVRGAPAGRDRRAGHRQGRGRRPADHLPVASTATAHPSSRSPTSPTAASRTGCRTLPGVAEVRIFGERRYAMRIWLESGARWPPTA